MFVCVDQIDNSVFVCVNQTDIYVFVCADQIDNCVRVCVCVNQLETVRSLAHNDNLFRMEVGKIAPTGEGELWMQVDDAVIAQNLHETILK